MDLQGKRNVYVASGPEFKPRLLTAFIKDDGQEITSLSITDDGKWVVFVRGGDHGGNYDHDRYVNPAADADPFKVQICAVPFIGGKVKFLSEGDAPVVSVKNNIVAFIKDKQAWAAPIDGSAPAKALFTTRGEVGSLQWSPDEKSLVFAANRTDHSLIGVYNYVLKSIKWVAPSFTNDVNPCWSPDSKQIAFIRMPGSGGAPDSLLANIPQHWSIFVADVATGKATQLWKAPNTLRGSFFYTDDPTNLFWGTGNSIVFLSYHDGWEHLYTVPASGGTPTLLTPGNFMAEHIRLSADRKYLTFSVNAGNDALDIERRHSAIVSVNKPDMQIVTQGPGLEWEPVLTDNNNTLAMISATARRPPLPAVLSLRSKNAKIQLVGEGMIPADFPVNKMVTPKQVVYKSPDGVVVHADLFEPTDGAAKHPAIVFVHGGPPRQMLLGWHYFDYYSNTYASNQYLASLGFVVLSVNYRLGIGYGYEFNQPDKAGPAGASEYLDIKAAGEWLQKQDNVDAGKIGIYGGSYGGYLTAMALARDSKLFAAGVDIHGVHDWVEDAGYITAFATKYEKAPDYDEAVKVAWQSSPLSSVSTWTSPVLIIHGDDDRNVAFNQSINLINRLEKKGVPYETLMIVDDTHHWMSFDNSIKVFGAVADFFVRQFKK